jgi:uncharacterized protein YgbK (DUF1537 family)
MREADLCLHLARQTRKSVRLVDILKFYLPEKEARAALDRILSGAQIVLFDALIPDHLRRIGRLLDSFADAKRPLFSVGSSGIETALAAQWTRKRPARKHAPPVRQILVGSGSCSPVTSGQIAWALDHGFAEVPLNTRALTSSRSRSEIRRATETTAKQLRAGRSVIVHTTTSGSGRRIGSALKRDTARVLGAALGEVLRLAAGQSAVRRICVAGGDTSSYASRAMGIQALEMIAPLTPGAPLCRAHAPGSPVDGLEVVFKGGQVGAENYFGTITKGKPI